ncbi:MAG: hypothetical protein V4625_03770 [Pseudomonadota bacterium]
MTSKNTALSDEAREHDRDFHAAFSAVREARKKHVRVRPHRAITPLHVTPWLTAQAIVLPLLLCGLIWWGKPLLLDFWRDCILFWSEGIGVPFFRAPQLNEAGQYALILSGAGEAIPLPTRPIMLVTAIVTALLFALSLGMKNASLPLKYPLRILCVVQAATLIYFWISPDQFPYTIARHSEELMTIGYVVIFATPVMLAMGYYILNHSLLAKLGYTALILGFFAFMVPHQVLVQALIMQHGSVLFMPVLYICFGAVFDALVFVALYSWAVSNAPADATL